MKAVIFSDSHGRFDILSSIAEKNQDAELFIFLGDGIDEAESVSYMYNQKKFVLLCGNCDWGFDGPETKLCEFSGKRIFCTHGASLSVKTSLDVAVSAAKDAKADILLFGHTHIPYVGEDETLKIMNPGSCGRPRNGVPSFGIIEVSPSGEISMEIKEI